MNQLEMLVDRYARKPNYFQLLLRSIEMLRVELGERKSVLPNTPHEAFLECNRLLTKNINPPSRYQLRNYRALVSAINGKQWGEILSKNQLDVLICELEKLAKIGKENIVVHPGQLVVFLGSAGVEKAEFDLRFLGNRPTYPQISIPDFSPLRGVEKLVVRGKPKLDKFEQLLICIDFHRSELNMLDGESPATYNDAAIEYEKLTAKLKPPSQEQIDRVNDLLHEANSELSGELRSALQADVLILQLRKIKEEMELKSTMEYVSQGTIGPRSDKEIFLRKERDKAENTEKSLENMKPLPGELEYLLGGIESFRAELGITAGELPDTLFEARLEYSKLIFKVEPFTTEQIRRFCTLVHELGEAITMEGRLVSRAQVDHLIGEMEKFKMEMEDRYVPLQSNVPAGIEQSRSILPTDEEVDQWAHAMVLGRNLFS